MTILHLRDIYFPEAGVGIAPPPEVILERFLNLEEQVQPLKLFLEDKHIGDAALSWGEAGTGIRMINLQGGALVSIPGFGIKEKVGLRATAYLRSLDELLSFDVAMRAPAQKLIFKASSMTDEDGQPLPPYYQLAQGDTVLIDSSAPDGGLPPTLAWLKPMILGELEKRKQLGQLSSTEDSPPTSDASSGLRSRTETRLILGRRRPVHVLEPEMDGSPIFQIVFTEGGELVEVLTAGTFKMQSLLLTLGSE